MKEDQEHQHAEVTITIVTPVRKNRDNNERMEQASRRIQDAVENAADLEFRTTNGVKLTQTETDEEAADRHMAEQEARHEREMERAADRAFEEGRW